SSRISEGNSKLQASQSVAMVGGPAAGGFLIRLVGAPVTIGLDALSFLGSALFVRRIRHPDHPPSREGRRSLVVEIREGLSFVLRHQLLLRITACTAVANLFGAMSNALLVLFVLRDLGLTEATLGVVFAVGAVGGLLGALVVGGVTRLVGEGRAIPLSALAWAPGAVLLPLAGPLPATTTLVVAMFVFSFCVVVYNVTQVSFRQRVCPRPLLGRMNASVRFLVWGCQPVGAALGGVLGQLVGVRPTLWVAAAGSLLAALPVVLSPLMRMRDLPTALDQHA
ncbi:MAG: MFS transporter, partial [Actinomycetes bacterium]